MRPLRRSDGAAAILTAAAGVADGELFRSSLGIMAVMRFAQTAGVRLHSRRRQRQRKEVSGERKQQQNPGDQALHDFRWIKTPSRSSIEHNSKTRKRSSRLAAAQFDPEARWSRGQQRRSMRNADTRWEVRAEKRNRIGDRTHFSRT